MAMSWEEIAADRMREINRLRAIVRCSTRDEFIVEKAASVYTEANRALHDAHVAKADDDILLSADEVRLEAKMQTFADFIALIEVMNRDEFIEYAENLSEKS